MIKLVAEPASGRLLGAHVLAPEGADTIQSAVLTIKHGLTVTDLAEALFPFLTTAEGLKLAALGFEKELARLSCCAGWIFGQECIDAGCRQVELYPLPRSVPRARRRRGGLTGRLKIDR